MTLLTELYDIDDVEGLLNTGWNAEVITKPELSQTWDSDRPIEPNEVKIGWQSISLSPIDTGYTTDSVQNTFSIDCYGLSKTDGLKLVSEVRRIINAATPSLGKIHITSIIPDKWAENNYFFRMTATQQIEGLGN